MFVSFHGFVEFKESVLDGEAVADLGEGAAGGEMAVDDDAHAVAEALDEAEDMGGEDDALALGAELLEVVGDGAGGDDVEAVGGLVEDDDVRVVDEGDDDAHLLLHAGGEVGHLHLGELVDAEPFEEGLLACRGGVGGHAVELAEEVVEVVGREEVLEFQLAGEEGNLGAHLLGLADDAAAVDPGVAPVGTDEGGEHAQGGGFARPVGAEEAEYLAAVGGHGQVVHGHLAALVGALDALLFSREGEGLAEPFDAEYFRHVGDCVM